MEKMTITVHSIAGTRWIKRYIFFSTRILLNTKQARSMFKNTIDTPKLEWYIMVMTIEAKLTNKVPKTNLSERMSFKKANITRIPKWRMIII